MGLYSAARFAYNTLLPKKMTRTLRGIFHGPIVCSIDYTDANASFIYIGGWAISKNEPACISAIRDENNTIIPHSIKWNDRSSISQAYFGDESRAKCAFEIQIENRADHSDTIVLSFSDNTGNKLERTLSRKRILSKAADRQKKTANNSKIASRYETWFIQSQLSDEQLAQQREQQFKIEPLISIVVPLYRTPETFLYELVDSCVAQTYSNWQLCFGDGSNDNAHLKTLLDTRYPSENRIVYKELEENLGISENTNAALKLATGDFIGLLDHDDLLAPNALFEVVKAVNDNPEIEALYTDEDKCDNGNGIGMQHFEPHFKPDFNLDLLRSCNYICHFFVVRKELLGRVGGFRQEFDGSQDYDFILRCTEQAKKVHHIPHILYYWRSHLGSVAGNPEAKLYAYDAAKRAIKAHLNRGSEQGTVTDCRKGLYGFYRIAYSPVTQPKVSVIIFDNTTQKQLLACIESVKADEYQEIEIIVISKKLKSSIIDNTDNTSDIIFTHVPNEFGYSQAANLAIDKSTGEIIIFLAGNLIFEKQGSIEQLVGDILRPNIGVVGAKIVTPHNHIMHAGVIIGFDGLAGRPFIGMNDDEPGYYARAIVQQDLTAISGGCLVSSRDSLKRSNGFYKGFATPYADIDFCIRQGEKGLLTMFDPTVRLICERATKGNKAFSFSDFPAKQKRTQSDCQLARTRWADAINRKDPYYNPNLSLHRYDFSCSTNLQNH